MKTKKWLPIILCGLALIGCEKTPLVSNDPEDQKQDSTAVSTEEQKQDSTTTPTEKQDSIIMSAEEQKQYLADAGKEFINTFNTNDQQFVIDLADGLYRKYESYDWDQLGDDLGQIYREKYESFFGLPLRYAQMAEEKRIPTLAMMEQIFSFANDSRNFKVDELTKTIIVTKSTDNACTATFTDEQGKPCSLRVWGEGATTEYTVSYREDGTTKRIRAQIPEKIYMRLMQNNSQVIGVSISLNTKRNDHLTLGADIAVANLKWQFDINITSTHGNMAFAMFYGSKSMIAATINLPKYQLFEKNNYDSLDSWEEWAEKYADRYESLIGQVGSGDCVIKIMDKVQIKAHISDGAELYDAIKNWGSKNDGRSSSLDAQRELCSIINQRVTAGLYYQSETMQAKVIAQPGYYQEEYYDYYLQRYITETRYEMEPVLFFPKDLSTYSFTEYFSASRFLILRDLSEDLINKYIDLETELGLDHVEF